MSSAILDRRAPTSDGEGLPPALPRDGGDSGGGLFGDTARFGMLAFMGTVTMLFVGFTSAYILREASADWRPLTAPNLIWWNTGVLLASSVAVERGRRALRAWSLSAVRSSMLIAGALGATFLAGQLLAWQTLASQGLFLATNPHSSFFYMLTGIHGLHLLGGLVWLAPLTLRALRLEFVPGTDALGLFALYWHFLGALWLYLAVLLFFF